MMMTKKRTNKNKKIKHLMPHACIGVDVIVGFPGEKEKDLQGSIVQFQS